MSKEKRVWVFEGFFHLHFLRWLEGLEVRCPPLNWPVVLLSVYSLYFPNNL